MTHPRVLIIRLLEACNAGCFMCAFARSEDPYCFGRAELRVLLDELQDTGIRLIRFTGGEPLLVPELSLMIADIHGTGRLTSVITNGWHLPARADELAGAGLHQVIASLDGPSPATHDRFRKLPGLFERLTLGLRRLQSRAPAVRLRVNTVVGPHNMELLDAVWNLLCDLGVSQWSLIPLKRSDRQWETLSGEYRERALCRLRSAVEATARQRRPAIIGPGLQMFGRTPAEETRLAQENRNMTPLGVCGLVDQVRYYIPKEGVVFPCNCVPHRTGTLPMFESYASKSFTNDGLLQIREWLRNEGPRRCAGCEPANVALAEGAIDLEGDVLAF